MSAAPKTSHELFVEAAAKAVSEAAEDLLKMLRSPEGVTKEELAERKEMHRRAVLAYDAVTAQPERDEYDAVAETMITRLEAQEAARQAEADSQPWVAPESGGFLTQTTHNSARMPHPADEDFDDPVHGTIFGSFA